MPKIVGVDPGTRGALSLIDTDANTIAIVDMPLEPARKGKSAACPILLAQLFKAWNPDYVFIEDVWSSPQQGVVSAFTFGRNLGVVEGAACGYGASLEKVKPQTWKGLTRTPRDKNEARARAMQVFPSAAPEFKRVKDDGRAEAALIAMYGVLQILRAAPSKPLTFVES